MKFLKLPTIKAALILGTIYIVGWFGLGYWFTHSTTGNSGFGIGILFMAWQYIFPIIAIIILIAVMIMESIDSKRNKDNLTNLKSKI